MASHDPVNIQRLVRQNDAYAKAEDHCRTITAGSVVSRWHERSFIRDTLSSSVTAGPGELTRHQKSRTATMPLPARSGSTCSALQKEAALEKKALLEDRRARLKELYRMEAMEYDKELSSLGLAMARDWS